MSTKNFNGNFTPGSIGIAGSLSGKRISHAQFFRNSLSYFEQRGIPAILGDDGATPKKAEALAEEFIARGVRLVIGHFNSDCARKVIPIYRSHDVELLLPASTDIGLDIGSGIFRLCANESTQAKAIVESIKAQLGDISRVEIRIDGTNYSRRLLRYLKIELDDSMIIILDTLDPTPPSAPVCIILAIENHAIDFVRYQSLLPSQVIYIFSDESDVAEFERVVADVGGDCMVVSPQPSYKTLLENGSRLAADWHEQNCGNLSRWLHDGEFFLTSGEAVEARWVIRKCCAARMN